VGVVEEDKKLLISINILAYPGLPNLPHPSP
jgi:hypothetical protein